MKKNYAIVLIIAAVVLCACPAIFFGGFNFFLASSPSIAATMSAQGAQNLGITPPQPTNSTTGYAGGACLICVGIIIPVIVALITLKMARKKETQSQPPL